MPTTLTNGIQLPDKGSVDWYSSMQSNYNLIDTHLGDTDTHVTAEDKANWNSKQGSLSQAQLDAIAQVATNTSDIATLQSGKADASHTHSSSDITDIGDYATKQYVDNSISGLVDNAPDALNTLNELSAALNDDSNFASTVTTALATKVNSADLATVATSGSYTDLTDKPTIPTNTSDLTNDSDFVVSSNLATIATSGDYDDLSNKPSIPTKTSDLNNDSGFVTLNDFDIPAKTSDLTNDSGFITSSDVPTSTSDLINDSNFVDTSNAAVASGITSAKVTDYDTHIADTDIHVTSSDKTTWNTVTSKANDSDVVHKSGDETIAGVKTFSDDITLQGTTTPVIKTISNIVQDTSAYNGSVSWVVRDKDNLNNILESSLYKYSAKSIDWQLKLTGIDNGVSNIKGIRFTLDPVNDVANFIPIGNNSTSLGNSSTKWSGVYATNYYYGSNNVEFSNKFVTTDTNQTISGTKVFGSNTYIYNSDNTATTPYLFLKNNKASKGSTSETGSQLLKFIDKNNNGLCDLESIVTSTGSCELRLRSNTLGSDNQNVQTGVTLISSKNGGKNFCPTSNDNVFLGASTLKWARVYATQYYYGNDNVEFSTKFVTTDTNQTITGNKTFSSNVNVYNSDSATDTANIILKNSKTERGSTTNIGEQNISFVDKNNAQIGNIKCITNSSGVSNMYISCNVSGNDKGIRLSVTPSTTYFRSSINNDCKLGTPDVRWSDVQTYKVNALEPSSLSLPSDRSARIDISSYITNLGNGGNNTYTVPANGYIFLHFTSINGALCYAQTPGGLTNYAQTFTRYQGDGQLYAFFPVRKDDNFVVQIYTSSTAEVQNAYFIPCQGNV